MNGKLVVSALATLAIFGCVGPAHPSKVVLRVSNWGGAGQDNAYDRSVLEIYREFERRNPGVEIRVESIPDGYNQKIILSHIANASPDIVMLDASYAALHINNGIVEDLQPYVERDPELKLTDFFPNVVDIARRGKRLYAIPQDFTPMVVYYNKDLFDRIREPYPDGSWNFEQFRDVARKLTPPSSKPSAQYGFAFANWMAGWVMWLWNNGGDVVSPDGKRATGTLDSPANAKTVGFLAALVKDELSPSLSQTAATGVDYFANGQAAMTVSGHWVLPDYHEPPKDTRGNPKIDWKRLGVCALPHEGPRSQTVMYESGYAIASRSKHKDLAWKFVKYMTSREVQTKYQASGIAICARRDVAKAQARAPIDAQFLSIVPLARAPYGSRIENYAFVEKIGQDAMNSVLQSGMSPEVALHRAALRIDQEFAKQ